MSELEKLEAYRNTRRERILYSTSEHNPQLISVVLKKLENVYNLGYNAANNEEILEESYEVEREKRLLQLLADLEPPITQLLHDSIRKIYNMGWVEGTKEKEEQRT